PEPRVVEDTIAEEREGYTLVSSDGLDERNNSTRSQPARNLTLSVRHTATNPSRFATSRSNRSDAASRNTSKSSRRVFTLTPASSWLSGTPHPSSRIFPIPAGLQMHDSILDVKSAADLQMAADPGVVADQPDYQFRPISGMFKDSRVEKDFQLDMAKRILPGMNSFAAFASAAVAGYI
ncbi:hypothetical protein HK405_007779, partial [Cladochytrium tenue]